MNIIYPPLVEQAFSYFSKSNSELTKAETYLFLIDKKIINTLGMPTKEALSKGWVTKIEEEQDLTFSQFLEIYPVFSHYERKFFKKIAGFWEVKLSLQAELLRALTSSTLSEEEKEQLEIFFSGREVTEVENKKNNRD
ncbi:hypothetical protein [Liquorilactobacillus satsumensis]|uniref:Uncharacterized protein n=2 Tax=Liquorilactobacillus satsumensis TaxID=259059 RepID=A0A0R1UW27_9LACO|nr:hypothetical protein [Liquorilactobacillus satsumensis]KRL97214.1 hypothetical protein FD50_GL001770 [Liquorilactobacillus satsumensis DSM 16230 = JCM 12392]MCC7666858.1 hypothetical protein [Liquorilactobacillus satsumensis]MCP9313635.1 hypothetical protein [Liquorilactobacillus satsumensis]MCP9328639.1 hypothetical protein [Liquorilactobacillus satsumensis]MCP9356960.1 hypothetical protein [Liquorilactobacillus satsumensis]